MGTNLADDLLKEYAESQNDQQSEALLEQLVVDHAMPAVRKIAKRKLASQGALEAQDIDDVVSDVIAELIGRLRTMKVRPAEERIGAFSGYAAVAAYHACNEYLRRKYPNRHRLKTRVRYLLNSDQRFALWEGESGDWLAGLAKWSNPLIPPLPSQSVAGRRDELSHLPHGRSKMHPADLLDKVLEHFGGPVELDDLVGVMGHLWGVEDPPPAPEKAAFELESTDADPATRFELKQWLNTLWREIRELPQAQRSALLLNLRSGPTVPAALLLPLTGVAGMAEIAATLGLSPDALARIWNQLPLEDLAIAERLGITRQQVINLRKSARERLIRRMGGKYRIS